ncbi:MAG TPA: GNAT family N-acetyltransferase [Kofleriaceae bacterium]|jgi:ribosomal protein S18 acetylase RimI-like enzyme
MTPLDNPLWASLSTTHAALRIGDDRIARYPRTVAPFLAVAHDGARDDDALAALVEPGETVLLLGPRVATPSGWTLEDLGTTTQLVATPAAPAAEAARVEPLGRDDDDRIRALAALVYPHYFRPRTAELGRYYGIRDGDALAAMAGERMGFPGYREISAVCTHPDHVGRGLARALLAVLVGEIRARGDTPFLHVSPANTRALRLYEQNGFAPRVAIAFAALTRLH